MTDLSGLSKVDAAEKLRKEGYNELPAAKKNHFLKIVLGVVREPMLLLLIIAGAIYLMLGDKVEAIVLSVSIFFIAAITIYQERKTERVLESLRDLSSPRALVIRDGIQARIPGREVVRGDIVLLSEGDRVPADGVLLSCSDIKVDESLLTGESVSVSKVASAGEIKMESPGGDHSAFVYSGTLVVQGQGAARIEATGINTEIGKIGKSLQSLDLKRTPLQEETNRLVRNLAILGSLLCLAVVLVYGLRDQEWLNGLLAGITLAMAILPEEFPLVLVIFLALGAWRISRNNVLTRQMPTIETLGAATVLCVDKTGTLTQNSMSVRKLVVEEQVYEFDERHPKQTLPEIFHELVEYSVLASETDPFDPMEKAFHSFSENKIDPHRKLHSEWQLVHEYSLSPQLPAMTHIWQIPGRDLFIVATKGAPEAVISLCRLDKAASEKILRQMEEMAAGGLRVLAVAKSEHQGKAWPATQTDFKFDWIGLIGLADPIRPTVPGALRECYQAGIRVVMITGDYPVTAKAIAKQLGFSRNNCVTGKELEKMNEDQLLACIKETDLFARVVPEQKLKLVNALRKQGEIVAMTGDGVNDAPALKAAHIGIAMGKRGTDVAREAASLVLLDDDFVSLVKAIRLGRRIFGNLRKAMSYLFAVHIPIVGMAFIPFGLGWPLMFAPVHIVFLEFIIDPACSIVFESEKEEKNIMLQPPRDPAEGLFSRQMVVFSIMQGLVALVWVVSVFLFSVFNGDPEDKTRILTFIALVLLNLGLIFFNRSDQPILVRLSLKNSSIWWVTAITLTALMLVSFIPFLRDLFNFAPLAWSDIVPLVGVLVGGMLTFEILRAVVRKFQHKTQI